MKIEYTKERELIYKYKISDDIFGIVQVRGSFCIFFDFFFKNTDKFIKINLNEITILHYRFVATQRIKNFFIHKESEAIPYNTDVDFLVLDFFYKSPNVYGANLSKLPKNLDMLPLEVVIEDLSVNKHYDELIKYDLISMIGKANDVQDRLKNYLETGIDFDKAKNFIFPDLHPKPKKTLPKILSEKDLKSLGYID